MATPRKSGRKRRGPAGTGGRRARKTRAVRPAEVPARESEAGDRPVPSIAAERARRARPTVIFEALATLLAPYAPTFEAEMHDRMGYCLKTYGEWPTEVYFAGVQWNERGLFFHLFPIAARPELAASLSPELLAHRDGRASFRFETFEVRLFAELAEVTARAYQALVADGTLDLAAAA